MTEADVMALHGMRPNATTTLKTAMKAKKLVFAKRQMQSIQTSDRVEAFHQDRVDLDTLAFAIVAYGSHGFIAR